MKDKRFIPKLLVFFLRYKLGKESQSVILCIRKRNPVKGQFGHLEAMKTIDD